MSEEIQALVGTFECSVDEKRRWSLPPRSRRVFGATDDPSQGVSYYMAVLPWYGGTLAAMPMACWKGFEKPLLALDITKPDLIEARRAVLSQVDHTHTDPEGRIQLHPDHHVWLGLHPGNKDRITVIGQGQYLEIWSAARWAARGVMTPGEYELRLTGLFQAIAAGLAPSPTERGGSGVPGGT